MVKENCMNATSQLSQNESEVNTNSQTQGEETVSMLDVVRYNDHLDKEGNSMIGEEDRICSYNNGYIFRQPIYSCLTCFEESNKTAGICYSCSVNCHEDHDLVELYTKRTFRCDCGNDKFNGKCLLEPDKDSVNENNIYCKNFKGIYCTCNRPYPDEQFAGIDLINCIVCEDWFHTTHVSEIPIDPDNFTEFVCQQCSEKVPFLKKYCMENDYDCQALFFTNEWRIIISEHDKNILDTLDMSFLYNIKDTYKHYKDTVNSSNMTTFQKSLEALTTISKPSQLKMIEAYQDMKDKLIDHLKTTAKRKSTIDSEDITEFFSTLKKMKSEDNGQGSK